MKDNVEKPDNEKEPELTGRCIACGRKIFDFECICEMCRQQLCN